MPRRPRNEALGCTTLAALAITLAAVLIGLGVGVIDLLFPAR